MKGRLAPPAPSSDDMQAAHACLRNSKEAPACGALLLGRQAAGCEPLMGRPRDTFVIGLYRYICYPSSGRGIGSPGPAGYQVLSRATILWLY